jgi:hypothetical protein
MIKLARLTLSIREPVVYRCGAIAPLKCPKKKSIPMDMGFRVPPIKLLEHHDTRIGKAPRVDDIRTHKRKYLAIEFVMRAKMMSEIAARQENVKKNQ